MLDFPCLFRILLKTHFSLNVQQHITTLESTVHRNVVYISLIAKNWEQCILVLVFGLFLNLRNLYQFGNS